MISKTEIEKLLGMKFDDEGFLTLCTEDINKIIKHYIESRTG